jgi:MerR family transcriptional regulator, light-induced transcriptional regulator
VTIGIGELARRTGLTQQAIRAWESRFGFPVASRTAGGRRQYPEAEVDRVHRVLALRDTGVKVSSAIARISAEQSRPPSIFAELRRLRPELERRVLGRDALVAISRAIEDEVMARTSRPHVFAAFQREQHFRAVSRRWQEIARTASSCLVFADFPSAAAGDPNGSGSLVRVPLEPDAPLLREWAVVVVAPSFSVVLTAWEIPQQEPVAPEARRYETVFSFDPDAVRLAADVCIAAAGESGVVNRRLSAVLDDTLAIEPTDPTGADALVMRAFDYLQGAPR